MYELACEHVREFSLPLNDDIVKAHPCYDATDPSSSEFNESLVLKKGSHGMKLKCSHFQKNQYFYYLFELCL